jgi:hypothetical protein
VSASGDRINKRAAPVVDDPTNLPYDQAPAATAAGQQPSQGARCRHARLRTSQLAVIVDRELLLVQFEFHPTDTALVVVIAIGRGGHCNRNGLLPQCCSYLGIWLHNSSRVPLCIILMARRDHGDLAGLKYKLPVVDECQNLNACDLLWPKPRKDAHHRRQDRGGELSWPVKTTPRLGFEGISEEVNAMELAAATRGGSAGATWTANAG